MIRLPDIDALELVGVYDRGVPNSERIVIRALKVTEMAQYGIIAGWNPMGSGTPARPFNDNFFWFGDGVVQPNDFIFVYTGSGEPRKTTVEETDQRAYVVHWGRATTVFADSRVVPVLVAFGQVLVGQPPLDLPQLKRLTNS